MITPLSEFKGINICINITQQCNLRCKYCYEHKEAGVIKLETAKKFIDLILSDDDPSSTADTDLASFTSSGLVLDLIGGDALMHPELCDQILTYLQLRLYVTNSRYKDYWRCSISTNGTLFSNPKVKAFLKKWQKVLSISVSIDGCPEIHDMNRIFIDGSPSMEKILEEWGWYRDLFPIDSTSTKSTCSKSSIPYLYDSLVYMHETLGLNYINQNFIMEETGCTEEDYAELDKQLEKCVDYVLKHKDELYWSMIDRRFTTEFLKSTEIDWNRGFCGSGMMPACSINGDIYPCFRWLPISMNNQDTTPFICGNVDRGFYNKKALKTVQCGGKLCNCCKDLKCMNCELLPACSYCIAGCYAELGEFRRTTHNCEFTKLQHKWADIYWSKYDEMHKNY